ncbi:Sec-independent protein translocase protein TatC [uncultured Paludibacter sp.]|uniref:Sec-independent protein translocase protein TatC n=1 Tax=uncultured Paludibacter sp. TaxID=497635 RepID=A0A653AIZ7_9BACT|nr:Sec-independent protein translocase protein TatC [uncultured Paludibacter sp.]
MAEEQEYSFWEHLEVLRWTIIRILAAVVVLFVLVFVEYKFVFSQIVLSPLNSDFISYRILKSLLSLVGLSPALIEDFKVQLINYELSGQFLLQIGVSLAVAAVVAFPYVLFELWRFVRPALYENESKNIGKIFFFSSFLFYLGAAVSYFIIFPLTIRFLGTYQVSELIPNQISVQSYFNALVILVLCIGLTFEMPILSFFLSKAGIVSRKMLAAGRKYAFVIILVLAAIITPTTDPFTLMVVTIPLYLLYEVSIWVCKKNEDKKEEDE